MHITAPAFVVAMVAFSEIEYSVEAGVAARDFSLICDFLCGVHMVIELTLLFMRIRPPSSIHPSDSCSPGGAETLL